MWPFNAGVSPQTAVDTLSPTRLLTKSDRVPVILGAQFLMCRVYYYLIIIRLSIVNNNNHDIITLIINIAYTLT